MRALLALLLCLGLAACASAGGPATGFAGPYAGANVGSANLNTRSTPF